MSESEAMEEEPNEPGIASLSLGNGSAEGAVGRRELGWRGESSSTLNLPTPSDISNQDGQVVERLHALQEQNREYKKQIQEQRERILEQREQLQEQREQIHEQREHIHELQKHLEHVSVQPPPGVLLYVDPAFVSGGRGQATVTHQEVSDCLMRDAKFYPHFCQRVDPSLLVPSLGLPTGQEEFVMNLSVNVNKETANQFLWRYIRLQRGWPERLATALKERPGTTDLGNKVEEGK